MEKKFLKILGILTLTILSSCYSTYQTTSDKDKYISTNWGSDEGYRSNSDFSVLERYKDTFKPFFIEEFYDNFNDWRTESDEHSRCFVNRGYYYHIVDGKVANLNMISVPGLEDLEEYIIELSFFIDGGYFYDDWDIGIAWDRVVMETDANGRTSNKTQYFVVEKDNRIWIGSFYNEKRGYNDYCQYTNLKHNILSIIAEGNRTRFYVNGYLIHTLPYIYDIKSNKIGTSIGYVSARFDYLKIYQKK